MAMVSLEEKEQSGKQKRVLEENVQKHTWLWKRNPGCGKRKQTQGKTVDDFWDIPVGWMCGRVLSFYWEMDVFVQNHCVFSILLDGTDL